MYDRPTSAANPAIGGAPVNVRPRRPLTHANPHFTVARYLNSLDHRKGRWLDPLDLSAHLQANHISFQRYDPQIGIHLN